MAKAAIATTKLSSKGQIVIPESVREALGVNAGAHFVVIGDGDTIVLKLIDPPRKDINALLKRAHQQAKEAGLTQQNVDDAITAVRRARKKR